MKRTMKTRDEQKKEWANYSGDCRICHKPVDANTYCCGVKWGKFQPADWMWEED